MGPVQKRKSAKPTNDEWNSHKEILRYLYEEKQMSVKSIMCHMEREYKFKAKDYQYEYKLHTVWDMRSNVKESEWQSIIAAVLVLQQQGLSYEVHFRKRLISQDQINREISRRRDFVKKIGMSTSDPCDTLPKDYTIRVLPNVQSSFKSPETISAGLQYAPAHGASSRQDEYIESLLEYSPTYRPESTTEIQSQSVSLGIYEPHAWVQTIDWSIWTSITRLRGGLEKYIQSSPIHLKLLCHSPSQNNGQLINRDPDFLIPRCLLSSLLNGTQPPENFEKTKLHRVLRAVSRPVVLELFEKLASPSADILRERVFASALDEDDADIVNIMLHLKQDPCERISFRSQYHTGSYLPLERALYHRKFSVCKEIVDHLCKDNSYSASSSIQNMVLGQLTNGYYELVCQHPPSTDSEWQSFVDLVRTALLGGAELTNYCFFVAYYDYELADLLVKLDEDGVNGWIKRGLLASRWPDEQYRSSSTKQFESEHVHWILKYILRQKKEDIAIQDCEIKAEFLRALDIAVRAQDPGAVHIIVEACSDMEVDLPSDLSPDLSMDMFKPTLEQNWAIAQRLIEKHGTRGQFLDPKRTNNIQGPKIDSYEILVKHIVGGDGSKLLQIFQIYKADANLQRYLHTHAKRPDHRLFKVAVENNQLEVINSLFKGLTFEFPRRLEISWPLAHILQTGNTAAISAILSDSKPWAAALSSTLETPFRYLLLEDLLYRVQSIPALRLTRSNAHQQIALRCVCYYAFHTNDESLLRWLVQNDLDLDEFGVYLSGETYQVSFENIQKITAQSGLIPNTGCGYPIHILPSLVSVAAMENKVHMINLLIGLGASDKDSTALARAVQYRAGILTVNALLQAANLGNRRTKVRHYGSAALREAIRLKDYPLIELLAKQVDVDSIELLPDEVPDPRSADALSPLGEAIFSQDQTAVEILLNEGCNAQALVCNDGSPVEHDRGAHLHRLSPLLAAIDLHNYSIVQMLVEKNAPVKPGPTQGLLRSPLQRAAEVGCLEIVRYLLSQGAPVDDPPFYSGGTPLQLAALSGHVEIAEFLIEMGADINHAPAKGDGRTAFEAAVEWGRPDMMSALVKRRVNLDLKFGDDDESQYQRALRYAERNGHMACRRYAQVLYDKVTATDFDMETVETWPSIDGTLFPGGGYIESEDVFGLSRGFLPIDSTVETVSSASFMQEQGGDVMFDNQEVETREPIPSPSL